MSYKELGHSEAEFPTGIQEIEMDALWQVLDEKLLLSFPIFSRRIEYLRLTQNRGELPSAF